ncbi:uncharacterized protein MYCGRDRAFT_51649 [Zymoseptoria tritici IPO323]|uniref:ParB/Sulfiredoxin domain-containing protein n=1 Tax=Zymoseptoria tritici (strain CBS 115943 / IPO323) TaxID=336722 RepID=F9XQM9_ZYMTI|nr:uncharacterized protein MYCGRDRAFT_51649 [Zymoseptoria tritici IPO323]EGP82388.1 hypothetical protein MYCGRDRAFT_51649 [Zymoseptoria tritici IPO323]
MAEVHTQIERHFKGFARVRLDHITFDSGRELDDRNVERLLGIFKLQGCQREEPGHSIPVLVDKDTLAAALAHEGSPPRILHQTSVEAEPLLFPSAITLTSLHGKHRVHAARKFLLPVDQWWTVKVFDTGQQTFPPVRRFLTEVSRPSSLRTRTPSIRVLQCTEVF